MIVRLKSVPILEKQTSTRVNTKHVRVTYDLGKVQDHVVQVPLHVVLLNWRHLLGVPVWIGFLGVALAAVGFGVLKILEVFAPAIYPRVHDGLLDHPQAGTIFVIALLLVVAAWAASCRNRFVSLSYEPVYRERGLSWKQLLVLKETEWPPFLAKLTPDQSIRE